MSRLPTLAVSCLVAVGAALTLTACGGASAAHRAPPPPDAVERNSQLGSAAGPPAPQPAPSPASATQPAPAPTAGGELRFPSLGVKECDDFLTHYVACLDRMGPEASAAGRDAARQMYDAWAGALAGNPQLKDTFVEVCTKTTDAMREPTAQYGCTW